MMKPNDGSQSISQLIVRLDDRLEQAERFLAIFLYVLLIAAIAVNVFARDVLHTGSVFLLQSAPFLVLWLALVGATLGFKRRRHITIGLLLHGLPPRWRRAADRLTGLLAMLLSGALCGAAVVFVKNEIDLFGAWGWRSVCFPIFFLIVFFRSALRLLGRGRISTGMSPQ